MGLPIINGTVWGTWNGMIQKSRRPVVTFDSPVLRGSGATVLPERCPVSQVTTQTWVKLRTEADTLIDYCYLIQGFLISVTDDEGVVYSNVLVRDVNCTKRAVVGQTTDGATSGTVQLVVANWSFIAPLPENS